MTDAGRATPAASGGLRKTSTGPRLGKRLAAGGARRWNLETVRGRALAVGLAAAMGALVPFSVLPAMSPSLRLGIVWLGPLAAIIAGIVAGKLFRSWWAVGILPLTFGAFLAASQISVAGTAPPGHTGGWWPVLNALPGYLFVLVVCVAIGVASVLRPGSVPR